MELQEQITWLQSDISKCYRVSIALGLPCVDHKQILCSDQTDADVDAASITASLGLRKAGSSPSDHQSEDHVPVATRLRQLCNTIESMRDGGIRDLVRTKRQYKRERDELAAVVDKLKASVEDQSMLFTFSSSLLRQLDAGFLYCESKEPLGQRKSRFANNAPCRQRSQPCTSHSIAMI